MVEQTYALDNLFGALSDATRRDMLQKIRGQSMSVSEVARDYALSFAGVAKHLSVLERAGLIRKAKQGREQLVSIDPKALAAADEYLEQYRQLWEQRLDNLDTYLQASSP